MSPGDTGAEPDACDIQVLVSISGMSQGQELPSIIDRVNAELVLCTGLLHKDWLF